MTPSQPQTTDADRPRALWNRADRVGLVDAMAVAAEILDLVNGLIADAADKIASPSQVSRRIIKATIAHNTTMGRLKLDTS